MAGLQPPFGDAFDTSKSHRCSYHSSTKLSSMARVQAVGRTFLLKRCCTTILPVTTGMDCLYYIGATTMFHVENECPVNVTPPLSFPSWSLIGCCSSQDSFQIFSMLDILKYNCRTSLNSSHTPLQHRLAIVKQPLICLNSGAFVWQLIKPVGDLKIRAKVR